MRIRNSFIATVLAMMVLCAGNISFTATAANGEARVALTSVEPAAPSCATVCFDNYIACRDSCGGDPGCLAQCRADFDCCRIICHGQDCLTRPLRSPLNKIE